MPPGADGTMVGLGDGYRYFDQPIDQNIYLIRPGDKLIVTFIKAKLAPLTLSVDPEGKVVNATLGVFDLSHKTLFEAKGILRKALRELYNVDEMAISVTEPAKVGILVSGAIAAPGLYTAYTSQRVSEIIDSAGGVIRTGSRRWIIFSGGPQEIIVDLDQADYLGDNTANPCLYAGYSIYVPSKSAELVQVVGEVNNPREIELVPGDDLNLLLSLAGGVRSNGDIDAVRIIGGREQSHDQKENIQADDIILVPPKSAGSEKDRLIIFGAVSNPGRYKYHQGMTLEELIRQAGDFTSRASSSRTTVFRRAEVDEWGRTTKLRYAISNVVKTDEKIETVVLQPADSVFVPVKVGYVKVSGEVHNPGLFPFGDGGEAMFYIDVAGGFLPTANKSRIDIYNRISRITSSYSPEVLVHDGDEIIVNVREELK
jgi:protein involved in polysaccharide export with SLBB domain